MLREFGAPKDAAARYAPEPQYLIGPRLYPTYVTAVKVMLPILAAIVARARRRRSVQAIRANRRVLVPFVRATGSFLWSALINVGIMTMVFALVERSMRRSEANGKAWDPSSLPQVDDPDRISYFGRIFCAVRDRGAGAAVQRCSRTGWPSTCSGTTEASVYPLLTPAFGRHLPLINAWWLLAFVQNLAVLRQGRWTRATRWADFGLEVFRAVILLLIVTGPPVFRYDAIIKVVLQWFLVFSAIRACVLLYRLLRRRPAEPWART